MRPNAGTVPPGGDAEIKVMLQPGQTDEKHKFMVQSIYGKISSKVSDLKIIVPGSYNELETKEEKKDFISELWRNPAENPVMSSKLVCHFLVPLEEVRSLFTV